MSIWCVGIYEFPYFVCVCCVLVHNTSQYNTSRSLQAFNVSYLLMRRRVNSRVPPDTDRVMMFGGAEVVLVVLGEVYLK